MTEAVPKNIEDSPHYRPTLYSKGKKENKPVKDIRSGNVSCAAFKNLSSKGRVYYIVRINKFYQDKSGKYINQGINFDMREIRRMRVIINQMENHIMTIKSFKKHQT